MLDSDGQTLTIEAGLLDYGLNKQIFHMRVGVASVEILADAFHPIFWDVTVQFIHPCQNVSFKDNGGVTSPIIAVVREAPHPYPINEIVLDFPHDDNG